MPRRWLIFALVQLLLLAAWWYLALWIAVGLMGVQSFRGWRFWAIFLALAAASLAVHAVLLSRARSPRP